MTEDRAVNNTRTHVVDLLHDLRDSPTAFLIVTRHQFARPWTSAPPREIACLPHRLEFRPPLLEHEQDWEAVRSMPCQRPNHRCKHPSSKISAEPRPDSLVQPHSGKNLRIRAGQQRMKNSGPKRTLDARMPSLFSG